MVDVQPLAFPALGAASLAVNTRVDSLRLVSPFEVFDVCVVRGRLSACVIVTEPERAWRCSTDLICCPSRPRPGYAGNQEDQASS